jgi:hypothetical protein
MAPSLAAPEFDFDEDLDPDPAFGFDGDPCGSVSGSATLLLTYIIRTVQ